MSFVWWPIKQFTNNNNNNLVTFLNRMLSWDRLFSMDSFPPLSPIAPGFNPMQTIYSFSWFIWLILIFAIEVYYNYGVSMVYSGSFNHLRSESGFPGFPPKNVKMWLFTWQEQRRALLNHSLQQAQTSTSICWSSSSISTATQPLQPSSSAVGWTPFVFVEADVVLVDIVASFFGAIW